MGIYYALKSKEKNTKYTYIGDDPNFKNQKCIILERYGSVVKAKFSNEYLGNIETYVSRKDLFFGLMEV